MIQKLLRLIVCACIIVSSQLSIFNYAQAQTEWLPEKSNRLVNDYSGMLTAEQVQTLEQRLVAFNDSTSNQVLIVITPTIGGDDEDAGVFHGDVHLGNGHQPAVTFLYVGHQLDGLFPSHGDRKNGAGEHDGVAQGQDGHHRRQLGYIHFHGRGFSDDRHYIHFYARGGVKI